MTNEKPPFTDTITKINPSDHMHNLSVEEIQREAVKKAINVRYGQYDVSKAYPPGIIYTGGRFDIPQLSFRQRLKDSLFSRRYSFFDLGLAYLIITLIGTLSVILIEVFT
jgi:hypothetical protein